MKRLTHLLVWAGAASAALAQCEEAELASGAPVFNGDFGWSVDIDGDRAIVGQPVGTGFGESAHVYRRSGSTWALDAVLAQPGQELDVDFGARVAIEADLAAVAASADDQAGGDFGAVYLYDRSSGAWTWDANLLPAPASQMTLSPAFGEDVAIEGGTVFVGAPYEVPPVPGAGHGAVYVFERIGGQWAQVQKLAGPDLAPSGAENFGSRLATDEDHLAVGVPYPDAVYTYAWQVRIYERSGPGQPFAFLDHVDSPAGIDFSFMIAVDLDGDDLVVGSHAVGQFGPFGPGMVYFHRRVAGAWTLLDTYWGSDFNPADDWQFGSRSVAVEDGVGLVSDPEWYPGGGVWSGSAHMFLYDGTSWIHRGRVQPADGIVDDRFSLDLALDAGRAIFGAIRHNHQGPGNGAAYVVDMTPLPAVYCTGKLNSLGCAADLDWHGIASLTNVQSFDVTATSILSNKPGLFFYGTSGQASIPFLGGTLCAQPPLARTPPQTSGGQGPPDTCTGTFTYDLNARIQSGADPDLVPGASVAGQFWSRDPNHPDGTGVHLTEAIEVTVCP